MPMKFTACLISFISLCAFPAMAMLEYTASDARTALEALDDSLAKRQSFIARRQAQIDRLADSLSHHPTDSRLMLQIGERYTAFNNDSALHYFAKGRELAKDSDKLPFELQRVSLMPLSGSFPTAIMIYDSIDADNIPTALLPMYYEAGRQMYSYMAAFSENDSNSRAKWNSLALDRQKRLLEVLPKEGAEYKYHLGEYFFQTGEKGKARALLESVFESEPYQSNLRARAAHHLSTMARERADDNAYVYYIAQAAIADVIAATREVAALQELGNYLYTQKDVNRSYTYLTEALANAVECGAPLRMVESSRSLPIIERAKTEQIEAKTRTIYVILGILVLILVGLVITMLVLRHEMKRMKLLQDNLRQANRTKEVYISQCLSLCSIYMDKLNQFCKIANRKISTGKVDDLYRLTKSGKFVEEQSKEFYDVFDNAFLHLYPNFITQVNALLRPDSQIELKDGELLNTDLRILAFMRLGIEESARIAQVLNYSINTIYAYRNRTKARAIDRDNFEDDIMKISSVS